MGATPGMVNMISPEGISGSVPASAVPTALADGHKLGIHVYLKDGTSGIIPHDQLGAALKDGATYSPGTASDPAIPHGLMQSLVAPIPQLARGLYHNVVDAPRDANEAAIAGTTPQSGMLAQALGHIGLGGYRTLIAPSVDNAKAAYADAQSPNLSNRLAAGSEAIGAIPILGPGVDAGKNIVSQYLSGDRSGAVGSTLGNLGAAGLTAATIGKFTKPTPTNLTTAETASRGVAKSVLPKEGDFNAFTDALQREKGNVDQFASQQGMTTRTPLDTSIAARQSADSLGDFYRDKLLGPVADQSVPVPAKFDQVGSTAPSGSQYATLRQIDQRINDLNDIIRPARNNATQGATATDLANLQQVVAEHDSLVNILHNKLGAAAGVDPSVIAGVRQSIGARAELADQLGASANRSTLKAGQVDRTGSSISKPTVASTIIDAINKLRGGPEAIANRSFQKAYPSLDVPSNIGNPATIEELRSPGIAQYFSKR